MLISLCNQLRNIKIDCVCHKAISIKHQSLGPKEAPCRLPHIYEPPKNISNSDQIDYDLKDHSIDIRITNAMISTVRMRQCAHARRLIRPFAFARTMKAPTADFDSLYFFTAKHKQHLFDAFAKVII